MLINILFVCVCVRACVCVCVCVCECVLSCVLLFVTTWTVAHQAPVSHRLIQARTGSGLSFSLPGDLPDPGNEPKSPASSTFAGAFFGFPCGSAGQESTCNAEDLGSVPGLGRSPGEGKGLPTAVFWPREFHRLYSPWGYKDSDPTQRLSLHFFITGPPGSPNILFQFSSVAHSCLTLSDPMDYSTPGLPVYHQLPEFYPNSCPLSR